MSFLDQLRAMGPRLKPRGLSSSERYRVGCFDLYLFFEGNDDFSFYQPYLRQVWQDRGVLHGFNCDGKQAVIQIIPKVKSKLDYEWRGLFFVDKDVDDFCGHTRHADKFLYETEYYSIESFITCEKALGIIWTDLLSLSVTDTRWKEVLTAYASSSQSFYLAMKDVMAWIIHLRGVRTPSCSEQHEHEQGNWLSMLTAKAPSSAGWADHIHAASSIAGVTFDPAAHSTIVAQLTACDPKTYIRGKFEMWFFVAFVMKMLEGVSSRMCRLTTSSVQCADSATTAVDVFCAVISSRQIHCGSS